ncbi:MAG TPA: shikimate kinase [Tepidimicrobium sp.]|nr:shikimate kinase [Tepidimicrobium sp.]
MKNIVLIGMSGSGKTSVGKFISNILNMEFIDTDQMLITKSGMDISHIFNRYGEDYFRAMERRLIKDISSRTQQVISTGGGIVLSEDNIRLLRKNGMIFFLKGTINTLVKNLKSSGLDHRPLLAGDDELAVQVGRLYKNRRNLYLDSADIIVSIDNKAIEEIGKDIIRKFKQIPH